MGGPALLLQWLPVLALGFGILLLAFGIRGRQVHARPTCRRCRFDLSGTLAANSIPSPNPSPSPSPSPAASDAPIRRCPECGSSLAEPHAVREGIRRPLPKIIAAATLLILVGVLGISAVAINRSTALVKYLPTWYLASQTNGPQDFIAQRAIIELDVRAGMDSLSAARAASLVQHALAVQADKNSTWLPEWGNLIGTLRGKGLVTDAQFSTFIRQGADISLETRPIARAGESLPVRTVVRPNRMADQAAGASAYIRYQISQARTPDATLGPNIGIFISGVGSMGGMSSGVSSFPLDVPVGETELTLVLAIDADTNPSFATPLASWTQSFTLPLKVVPPGTPLVQVIDDAALTPAMQSAIAVNSIDISATGPVGIDEDTTYNINFSLKALPQNVAFEIHLRRTPADITAPNAAPADANVPSNAAEIRIGSIVWMQGETGGWGTGSNGPSIPVRPGDSFNLILRPSLNVAEADARLTRYWHGELTYPNIKINDRRQPSATTK
jgi:hypothetical protein